MADERGASAIHEAGNLSYSPGNLRDDCWPALPKDLRKRITETVGGELTQWWATRYIGGSMTAVALGPAGLSQADPVTEPNGKPGFRLRTARFAPQSLWVLATGTPEPLPASSASAIAGDGAVLESSLTEDFRGLLGNLPPITQILLQERFSPRPDLTYGYYAEVRPTRKETTWRFLCYLTDDKTAMFGSGTKVTPAAPGSEEVWDVTCYRATVTEQMPLAWQSQ